MNRYKCVHYKKQKLKLVQIFNLIPKDIFLSLAEETNVDYYAKALHGKLFFYLLLYALLTNEKISQRGVADIYSSPAFKCLFHLHRKKKTTLSHSSISDRLATIKVEYFKRLYECIYERFSSLYPSKTLCGMKLQRVDSSLVADISGRIREGLTCGNEHKKGKMVKFTINFDGMYASIGKVHKEEKYASEALALPENVIEHFEQHKGEYQVYLIDRGQSSAEAFVKMKSHNGLLFVGRLLKNRKIEIIRKIDYPFRKFEQGTLILDALVQLYKTENVEGKNGKMQRKPTLVNEKFRVIKFRPKDDKEDILLITNILNHRAETIATMYRRRWDIEVFFRFLKQNVNFSHLMSLNDNGIQVILYMTLIAAMLIMIYKKENELGYKEAKRRIKMELEEMTIAIAVKLSGGDLSNLDLPPPWDIEL